MHHVPQNIVAIGFKRFPIEEIALVEPFRIALEEWLRRHPCTRVALASKPRSIEGRTEFRALLRWRTAAGVERVRDETLVVVAG